MWSATGLPDGLMIDASTGEITGSPTTAGPAMFDITVIDNDMAMGGLYYEQFSVGQRFEHVLRRTVTEADNLIFSTLTHNPAALHLVVEALKESEFGTRIVNCCFTLSGLGLLWAGGATLYLLRGAGHAAVTTRSALGATDAAVGHVRVSLLSAEGVWVVALLSGVTLLELFPGQRRRQHGQLPAT